jgi:hypothetical protein
MHQQLDEDNIDATKVLFNLMMRLKQHFRENKEFTNAFQNDKPACYHAEHYFRSKTLRITDCRVPQLQLIREVSH